MWHWTEECELLSFQSISGNGASTFGFPRLEDSILRGNDASGIAVGVVLTQDDGSGKKRILEFFSSKLNDAQRKYSAGELKTYAVVMVLRKWKVYL